VASTIRYGKRAAKSAERRAAKESEEELVEIEREEAQLRQCRQSLRMKFHLRSVKWGMGEI